GLLDDYVRLSNVEVRNGVASGIDSHANHWELLNLHVHHNGSTNQDHGAYLSGIGTLIDGGEYDHNSGYGAQIFDSGQTTDNDNVVRNGRYHDNFWGLIISSGVNNAAYNNLVYHNKSNGIDVASAGYCGSCLIYNNT